MTNLGRPPALPASSCDGTARRTWTAPVSSLFSPRPPPPISPTYFRPQGLPSPTTKPAAHIPSLAGPTMAQPRTHPAIRSRQARNAPGSPAGKSSPALIATTPNISLHLESPPTAPFPSSVSAVDCSNPSFPRRPAPHSPTQPRPAFASHAAYQPHTGWYLRANPLTPLVWPRTPLCPFFRETAPSVWAKGEQIPSKTKGQKIT